MKYLIKIFYKMVFAIIIAVIIFNIALQSIFSISGAGISILDIYKQTLPKNDAQKTEYRDTYLVKAKSYFEKQERGQCAGFSAAYALRILGEDISGKEIYTKLEPKFSNGYVMPQGIIDVFSEYGHDAKMLRGDLEQLKTRLNRGNPIIVLIGHSVSWQHYVTVVGYDEDNIFFYDSNKAADNSYGYNRTMTNAEFVSQWKNGIPLFEQIYFVAQ
ncbi:MAG: hypothetical protein GXY50_08305 [Syntrophomonadaceae bacterium]|nr:hypothetical protein [Syntrophomonadaceae bacterium]